MNVNLPGINPIRMEALPLDKGGVAKDFNWQFGQLLKAVVAVSPQEGRLLLNIDGKLLQARSNQQFQTGEVLDLKVGGDPKKIMLTVLDRDNQQAIIKQALRQSLPKQMPAQTFLNQLQQLPKNLPTQENQYPPQLIKMTQQLLTNISSLEQISKGPGLKQAIKDMGLFLENKLLHATRGARVTLSQDQKALLLQLKQVVDKAIQQDSSNPVKPSQAESVPKPLSPAQSMPSSPTQTKTSQAGSQTQTVQTKESVIAKQDPQTLSVIKASQQKPLSLPIQGSKPQPIKHEPLMPIEIDNKQQLLNGLKEQLTQTLARVQSQQLASLPQEPGQANQYLFDLPVKVGDKVDVLPFLIEEEDAATNQTGHKKSWSVMLALDLDKLGEMQIKVALRDEQVTVNFWSSKPTTAQLVASHQSHLKDALAEESLELDGLQCHHGLKESKIDGKSITLLDIKA